MQKVSTLSGCEPMKCQNFQLFRESLTNSSLSSYLILHPEKEERNFLCESAARNLNREKITFASEEIAKERLFQEVESLPLFSKKRALLLLFNIDQYEERFLEKIASYLEMPNTHYSLLMTAGVKASRALKKIMEKSLLFEIAQEKPWERETRVAEWLILEASERGLHLPREVALALVERVEAPFLRAEFEKLLIFIGEKERISLEDLAEITIHSRQSSLWQFGDAIFQKERAKAIKIASKLLEGGVALFLLLSHLKGQVEQLLRLLLIAENEGRERAREQFPYLKGGLLDAKISLAQKYGPERLQTAKIQLFDTELKLKNSLLDAELLLEILIVKLSA
jgi:DNA polymerase III delta subunit